MGSGDNLRFRSRSRFRFRLRLRKLTLGLTLLVALTSSDSVTCEVSENQQPTYAPLSLQQLQLQQQQQLQQQHQQQHPTQFYSYPTLSYAPPPPAFAFPMAPLGGLGQGQLVGPLTTEQSGLFSALSRSNPDMFYFSPRDQVLYKVSLIPFENLNGNALGGGQPLPQPFIPSTGFNTGLGFLPPLATTGTGTGTGTGAVTGTGIGTGTGTGASVAPPTPAPTVTTAAQPNNGTPVIDNSGSPPFAIEFEVEEETGGAYVGGFGAEENKNPGLAPVSSGASAGPIASGAGSGSGSGTGSSSSASGTGSGPGPASGVQNVGNINQLLNALRPPPASHNLDEFNNNNFQTYDPSLLSPASSGSVSGLDSGSGSGSGLGYSSQEAGYDSLEQVETETETEPGGYGSSTEQFSQVVLPSDIRISPELARFLAQLTASANAGLGRLRTATNSVVPSAALPENLDAATGTPGQQERRVRKRMKFKSGGAIG